MWKLKTSTIKIIMGIVMTNTMEYVISKLQKSEKNIEIVNSSSLIIKCKKDINKQLNLNIFDIKNDI